MVVYVQHPGEKLPAQEALEKHSGLSFKSLSICLSLSLWQFHGGKLLSFLTISFPSCRCRFNAASLVYSLSQQHPRPQGYPVF